MQCESDNTKARRFANIGKRLIFCLSLTIIAAIPSYISAVGWSDIAFDHRAVILAIAIYAGLWIGMSCLPLVDTLLTLPFVRRTLYAMWAARFVFTLSLLPSIAVESYFGFCIFDWVASIMPADFVRIGPGCMVKFKATLIIAMLDGAVNTLLLLTFAAILWSIQLVYCKRPIAPKGGFPLEDSAP